MASIEAPTVRMYSIAVSALWKGLPTWLAGVLQLW